MVPFQEERLLEQAVPVAPRLLRVAAVKELGGWWEQGPSGGRLYEDFQMLVRLSRAFPMKPVSGHLYNRRLHSSSITQLHRGAVRGLADMVSRHIVMK